MSSTFNQLLPGRSGTLPVPFAEPSNDIFEQYSRKNRSILSSLIALFSELKTLIIQVLPQVLKPTNRNINHCQFLNYWTSAAILIFILDLYTHTISTMESQIKNNKSILDQTPESLFLQNDLTKIGWVCRYAMTSMKIQYLYVRHCWLSEQAGFTVTPERACLIHKVIDEARSISPILKGFLYIITVARNMPKELPDIWKANLKLCLNFLTQEEKVQVINSIAKMTLERKSGESKQAYSVRQKQFEKTKIQKLTEKQLLCELYIKEWGMELDNDDGVRRKMKEKFQQFVRECRKVKKALFSKILPEIRERTAYNINQVMG